MTEPDDGSPRVSDSLASRCLAVLQARGDTLATAESLTAGLISATLAGIPGASAALRGGVAAYATDAKVSVLGVDVTVIESFGVISQECAEAMAEAARSRFQATWAVAATGVAGPDRQENRPVGTVYVAVAGPLGVQARELHFAGSRQVIRNLSAEAALEALLEVLSRGSQ